MKTVNVITYNQFDLPQKFTLAYHCEDKAREVVAHLENNPHTTNVELVNIVIEDAEPVLF